MRVSREQTEQNRRKIVGAAARLVREHGIASAGVDAITDAAGLTHGAFYSQFRSKDAAVAEAIRAALAKSCERWQRTADERPAAEALAEIVSGYLDAAHRDDASRGCVFAALGADVARQPRAVRDAFTDGLERSVELVASLLAGGSKKRRDDAIAALAWMSGALVIARAVSDPALSRRILEGTIERVSAFLGPKRRPSPKAVRRDG